MDHENALADFIMDQFGDDEGGMNGIPRYWAEHLARNWLSKLTAMTMTHDPFVEKLYESTLPPRKPSQSPVEKPKAEFPRKAMRRDWEPTV